MTVRFGDGTVSNTDIRAFTNMSTFISVINSRGRRRVPGNDITTNRMTHKHSQRNGTCVSVDTTTHFLFRYLCVFVYATVTPALPRHSFSNSTTELLVDTTVCSICAAFSFMESLGNNKRLFDDLVPSHRHQKGVKSVRTPLKGIFFLGSLRIKSGNLREKMKRIPRKSKYFWKMPWTENKGLKKGRYQVSVETVTW